MMTFATPEEYNDHLIQNLTKITLEDYFKAYHAQFYPDQDISFMEYFIEIRPKQHEFCVPHTKLFEYGIMSEGRSNNDVLRRLEQLNIKKDIHYLLRKVSQQVDSGTKYSDLYMLKPKAFKKMLMRAGRNSKQTINVEIYADYYLLLEDVYIDYTAYERGYAKKLVSIKDEKIDTLIENNNTLVANNNILIAKVDEQSGMITQQSDQVAQLLKYAKDTNEELHEIKLELVDIKAQLAKILKAVISLAYIPHIYKRFYDNDHKGKTVRDGSPFSLGSVGKTKSLVFVATYDPDHNRLKIEIVNRKLNEPLVQINKIISRALTFNENTNPESYQRVLMPQSYGVSTLHEQEVRSTYSNKNHFREIMEEFGLTDIGWSKKFKALIMNGIQSQEVAQLCFNKFIETTQANNIHSYDQALENSITKSGEIISPEALDELKRMNTEFVNNAKIIVDQYYKKMYVCQDRCPTYLRIRRNSLSSLPELKHNVRNLVIEGLDFE